MDISRQEQRVAALIGNDPNPADQIADWPHGAPAIGAARIVLLPAEPGVIAFLFRFLFESEVALIRIVLLLLLLGIGLVLLDLLVLLPQRGRTILGKED